MELINADSTSQRNKKIAGWKKVQWPVVLVFDIFPEGIMISEYARVRTLGQFLTLRVRWQHPIVGQIWSQIELLFSLEIGDVPSRISMATTRRGAFEIHIIVQVLHSMEEHPTCWSFHLGRGI